MRLEEARAGAAKAWPPHTPNGSPRRCLRDTLPIFPALAVFSDIHPDLIFWRKPVLR